MSEARVSWLCRGRRSGFLDAVDLRDRKAYRSQPGEKRVTGTQGERRKRRDFTKARRLFIEDTPLELRAILEEAAAPRGAVDAREPSRELPPPDRAGQTDFGESADTALS